MSDAASTAASSAQQPTRDNLIKGKDIAQTIHQEIKAEVQRLVAAQEEKGTTEVQRPGLAVVLVGQRPDSMVYVRMKRKTAEELGMRSIDVTLPDDVSQEILLEKIRSLNSDPTVHGILIQLPLPKHLNEESVLNEVSVEKDVDGLHPLNVGRLALRDRTPPLFVACTPRGCIELLDRMNVSIEGKNAVVVGRSNIVGIPMALLLMHRNATVTICHSRTQDLPGKVRDADIVVAALGKPQFIKGDWLKPGAIVIDVGINEIPDATKKSGKRLVGDVDFESCQPVAGLITPVPGGVGPMTIAILMRNTLEGFKRAAGLQ